MTQRATPKYSGATAGVVLDFTIHDRLRKARTYYDPAISQDAFGELINASGATVGNYELGTVTRLKDIYIRNWAEVTGVDYWWLKTGHSHENGPAPEETDPSLVPPEGFEPPTSGTGNQRSIP